LEICFPEKLPAQWQRPPLKISPVREDTAAKEAEQARRLWPSCTIVPDVASATFLEFTEPLTEAEVAYISLLLCI
jgi:hypothetical protein